MAWEDDWSRLSADVKRKLHLAGRKVALDAFTRVIMRTPVDTGRARGSWGVSTGRPNPGPHHRADPSGRVAAGAAAERVERMNLGDNIILSSNLPYIIPLENGHSQQTPHGMIGVTQNEMQKVADKAVQAILSGGGQ